MQNIPIVILEDSELPEMITTCISIGRLYIEQLSSSSDWVIRQHTPVYNYEGSGKA